MEKTGGYLGALIKIAQNMNTYLFKVYRLLIQSISKLIFKKKNYLFIADDDINSMSTLQWNNEMIDKDEFYLQTQIRISSHIASKALYVNLPRYRQHSLALKKKLNAYKGSDIESIIWARMILNKYKEKYEL